MTEYIKVKSGGFKRPRTLVYRVERVQSIGLKEGEVIYVYMGRRVRLSNWNQGWGQQKIICTGNQFESSRYELVSVQD